MEGVLGRGPPVRGSAPTTRTRPTSMKIVEPTIVRPWRDRIETSRVHGDGRRAQPARRAHASYVVLDPACGCGNFLYVAYRELRGLELGTQASASRELAEGERARPAGRGNRLLPAGQYAGHRHRARWPSQLARVTLWMGHQLAVEELDLRRAHAAARRLVGDSRRPTPCRLRLARGRSDHRQPAVPRRRRRCAANSVVDYVDWRSKRLRHRHQVTYCVYWFRKCTRRA